MWSFNGDLVQSSGENYSPPFVVILPQSLETHGRFLLKRSLKISSRFDFHMLLTPHLKIKQMFGYTCFAFGFSFSPDSNWKDILKECQYGQCRTSDWLLYYGVIFKTCIHLLILSGLKVSYQRTLVITRLTPAVIQLMAVGIMLLCLFTAATLWDFEAGSIRTANWRLVMMMVIVSGLITLTDRHMELATKKTQTVTIKTGAAGICP